MNDMVEVARVELAASPDLFKPLIGLKRVRVDRAKYIADKKKLTLFQIVSASPHSGDDSSDDEEFSVYSGLLRYRFEHDSNGNLYIYDQRSYVRKPMREMTKSDMRLCVKLRDYFNSKEPARIAKLFIEDAMIKVPSCHAMPDTCYAALYETVAKITEIEGWFKDKKTGEELLLLRVLLRSRGKRGRKSCLAICEMKFVFDYQEDKTKIKEFYFCHG